MERMLKGWGVSLRARPMAESAVEPRARLADRAHRTATGRQHPTRPWWSAWCYAETGKRDLRLDLLRGFAVLAMVVDHVAGPSWFYAVTGGNRFFVSAAEGFVILSGLVVGIVYGGIARAQGLRAAIGKLLGRAWLLYVLSVWLSLVSALLAVLLDQPAGAPFLAAPAQFVFEIITLRRTFYLVDVLLLYCFAMVAATGALALLGRGRWWAVLLASWALWGGYQLDPHMFQVPWPIADNPVFHFAPWQVLFSTALVLGYHRRWLAEHVVARWPRSPLRDGYLLPLGLTFVALIWLSHTNAAAFDRFAPDGGAAAILDAWFLKSRLPLPRLLCTLVVFGFFWALVTRCWRPLHALAGPFLLVLGQGALYAYAMHIFLVALVHSGALALWDAGAHGGFPALTGGTNATLQLAVLAVLWVLTRARFLQEAVAPLGRPPVIRQRSIPGRLPARRPSDALIAIALVGVVTGAHVLPRQYGLNAVSDETRATRRATTGAVGTRATGPVSTVTAPRSIANSAVSTAPRGGPAAAATAATQDAPAAATPTAMTPGQVRESTFFSRALGRTMPYGVYLPPGYADTAGRYPVLYMLHGIGGHYSEWAAYGLLETAERLIASGRITPLIIVLPQGDEGFFVNHAGPQGARWGDYLAHDLVAHIDANYQTVASHEARGVGGLSMGGFGALHLAFAYPDRFGAVGAHSPSLRTQEEAPDYLGDPLAYARIDPMQLAKSLDPARPPKIWIDVGVEDDWAARATTLKDDLRARGIRPEYRETAGGHDAAYWRQNAGRYLRFYGAALGASAQD